MYDPIHALIHANPKFHELVRQAASVWPGCFHSVMLVDCIMAFILTVAFRPDLARCPGSVPEFPGDLGHYRSGIGLIVSAFVLTGIYVHGARTREFDRLECVKLHG